MAIELKSAYDFVNVAQQNAKAVSMTSVEASELTVEQIRVLAEAVGHKNFVHRSIRQSLVYALQHDEKEAAQEADRLQIETAVKNLGGLSSAVAEVDIDGNILVKTGK